MFSTHGKKTHKVTLVVSIHPTGRHRPTFEDSVLTSTLARLENFTCIADWFASSIFACICEQNICDVIQHHNCAKHVSMAWTSAGKLVLSYPFESPENLVGIRMMPYFMLVRSSARQESCDYLVIVFATQNHFVMCLETSNTACDGLNTDGWQDRTQ